MYDINETKINYVDIINNHIKTDVYVVHDKDSVYKNINFYKIINITFDNQIYEFTIDNNEKFKVRNDEPLIFKNYGTDTIIDNNLLSSIWKSNDKQKSYYKVYDIININLINHTLEIEFKNFESKYVNIIIKLEHIVYGNKSDISNRTIFSQNKNNLTKLINEYKQKRDKRNSLYELMKNAHKKWENDSITLKNLKESSGITDYIFKSDIKKAKIEKQTSKEKLERAVVAYRNVYRNVYYERYKNEFNTDIKSEIYSKFNLRFDSDIDDIVYHNFIIEKKNILDELNNLLYKQKSDNDNDKHIHRYFKISAPLLITKQNIEKQHIEKQQN